MKKFYSWFLVVLMFFFQNAKSQNLWTKSSLERTQGKEKFDRMSNASQFQVYDLDFSLMKQLLSQAPDRESGLNSNVVVPVPNPDGGIEMYKVYRASIMHPDLARQHPDIQSYSGFNIKNPAETIRFSTTIFGFHLMAFVPDKGTFYIDTHTKDLQSYLVYWKKDLISRPPFQCHTPDPDESALPILEGGAPSLHANDSTFRVYRLAMACTIEYAAYHVNAANQNAAPEAVKKSVVLAAMNVTMTRVNGIYERDMALTMQLIPNNTDIIFITSDSFDNNNANVLINQSQTVIDSVIGSSNYDIGHTVSTGAGGLAQLNVPCTSNKAKGVTGSPAPVGDPFDVDYVAHEMGHQWGATHSFNNSCGGNRSASTSVEPGSGSTIMAYAGICPPDVQSNADSHFHAVSIAQMDSYMVNFALCGSNSANGNFPPVVAAVPNTTIPAGMPFKLTASATDANGDALTYCWEQTNNGGATPLPQPPQPTHTVGPMFRSLPPSSSSTRYFPRIQDVLNGSMGNTWEVLPTVARSMNFACTVRDNRTPNGGQTARVNTTVTTALVAPMVVTSQNTSGISYPTNSTQLVTWNVGGTASAPINTSTVNIRLSVDGGLTYPYLLVAATPNDGSESVTFPPAVSAPFCRIMIEPTNSSYYALNSHDFAIGFTVTTTCNTYTNNTPVAIPDSPGANVQGPVVSSTINVPVTYSISSVKLTTNISHTYIQDLVFALNHPDTTQRIVWNRQCTNQTGINASFQDGSPTVVCNNPVTGTFAPNQSFATGFNGKPANGNWTLLLADFYVGDTGTLNSWSIEICGQTITPMSVEDITPEGVFAVYPNPNTGGNFTFRYTPKYDSPIFVQIHDMTGRLMYQNTYLHTGGTFEQSVQTKGLSKGAYIFTISNGDDKRTHKILVD